MGRFRWVLALLLLSLIVLGAQTARLSQSQSDLVIAQRDLAARSSSLVEAQHQLVQTQTGLDSSNRSLAACRRALTGAIASVTLTSRASTLELQGGAARTFAAEGILRRATAALSSADVSACRSG